MLAYHYLQALELAQAAGDTRAGRRSSPCRRGASSRSPASGRSASTPPRQKRSSPARSSSRPPTIPERPELLVRWAEAAFQAGRLREAADALEQALDRLPRPRRARRRRPGADPALPRRATDWARAATSRSPPRPSTCSSQEPPGPTLVAAYTELAAAHFLAGAYARGDRRRRPGAGARRAAGPARAGAARSASAASPAPTWATRTGSPRWSGRSPCSSSRGQAGTPPRCRTTSRSPATRSRGRPARSPPSSRGSPSASSAASPTWRRSSRPTAPACSSSSAAPRRRSSGPAGSPPPPRRAATTHLLIWLRAVELATHLARGESEDAPGVADWLVETARERPRHRRDRRGARGRRRRPARRRPARAGARAARRARADAGRPRDSLLRQTARLRWCGPRSPPATPTLAKQLTEGLEPRFPLDEHALCAARAQLAEHAGDHAGRQTSTPTQPQRWQEFGNVPERAYALLGQGRCLLALGDPAAESRSPRHGNCSVRWATGRRSPRPKRCSSRMTAAAS